MSERPRGSTTAPRQRQFGQLHVHSCCTGPGWAPVATRSAPVAALVYLRGEGVVRHAGRSVTAAGGTLWFLPLGPDLATCHADDGVMVIRLPPDLAARHAVHLAAVKGRPVGAGTGAAAMLRGFLDALDRQPDEYRPRYPAWVQTCISDMVEQVLVECAATRLTLAEHSVLAARSYIVSHLSAAELTPQRAAAAAAVSLRTLNRLFAAEGDSVGGWIRRQRLERCRVELGDPRQGDRSIGQIAAQWGFPDAAHFSRTFKDAFGCSPRAYRALAVNRRDPAREPANCVA